MKKKEPFHMQGTVPSNQEPHPQSWMKRRLMRIRPIKLNKFTLNAIFIFALILLIVVNVFSYSKLKALVSANNWVLHTYEVIGSLDESLSDLNEIEANQRAYLITIDDNFLKKIDPLKKHLKEYLAKLASLVEDNPDQTARVMKFINSMEERLLVLMQVVNFRANSQNLDGTSVFGQGTGLKLFYSGHDLSNYVKALGQEIKSVELVLLKERNKVLLSKSKTTGVFIIIGSLVSFTFLLIPFLMANFELINRHIIESKVRNTQDYLRQIIESTSDMIATLDNKNRFQMFNISYQELFKHIFGKQLTPYLNIDEALPNNSGEKKSLVEIWKESLVQNEEIHVLKFTEGNHTHIYELSSYTIRNKDNDIKGVVHRVQDATNRLEENEKLQESYKNLEERMKDLQEKNAQITLLVDMSDIMLASSSQKELSVIMSQFAAHLLNFSSGYLYIMHPSKNYLELTSQWGSPSPQESLFLPDQCWGLRLGRKHTMNSKKNRLICEHIKTNEQKITRVCVPLMAQNDIYGTLLIELEANVDSLSEDNRLILTAFTELTALALANVRLRENLRYQSIRDPLTGLYNRRYLEDAFYKELRLAEREKYSFAILMLDLDHFKKINDTYGHDAGDLALKELGGLLNANILPGDLASRHGGEEFVIMFHKTSKEKARERAEEIRQLVSKMQVKYGAEPIGPFTISIGVAMFPEDGQGEQLIDCADRALYCAKKSGRDRVVFYDEI